MQTFLPVPSFEKTAQILDWRRLGKQRVEGMQILNAIGNPDNGWRNHPAVKMWIGYEDALKAYVNAIISEWTGRGYNNNMSRYNVPEKYSLPPWFGSEAFHLSHRSNLVRKNPEHYRQYWPDVPSDLPYVWPKGK